MEDAFADLHTPLYDLHVANGARMAPFAGYAMPIQYPAGIMREHLHTRARAGLFDTAHMGLAFLHGENAARALERLTPSDLSGLGEGRQRYCLLLNEDGGIRDDFMASRLHGEASLYLVVNAATKAADFAYIGERLQGLATLEPRPDLALMALQGPMAEAVLSRHVPAAADLRFMDAARMTVAGIPAIVSRSGYTGEDGFEIALAGDAAEAVAKALLAEPEVMAIGLGARDSLRLEAGLCLYGHDIDASADPAEAGLMWSIGKRRRLAADFPGADRILNQAPRRKRVGLVLQGRLPAREGAEIRDGENRLVGRVTSGGFAPSLNACIAMAMVDADSAAEGASVHPIVRGQRLDARIVPMPFTPHRYKRHQPESKA